MDATGSLTGQRIMANITDCDAMKQQLAEWCTSINQSSYYGKSIGCLSLT